MGQVKWTDKSIKNLQAIYNYISSDSEVYAARYINSLIKSTLILETQPFAGRIVPELNKTTVREILYRNYRIVYTVKNEAVEILTIYHAARQLNPETLEED